jgi:serine/threonine protein kinase
LVFGSLPYFEENPPDLFDSIQNKPVVLPEVPETVVSSELRDLLLTGLLEKDPSKRMTLQQLQDHHWISKHEDEESFAKKKAIPNVSITDKEVEVAISKVLKFETAVLLKIKVSHWKHRADLAIAAKARSESALALTSGSSNGDISLNLDEGASSRNKSPQEKDSSVELPSKKDSRIVEVTITSSESPNKPLNTDDTNTTKDSLTLAVIAKPQPATQPPASQPITQPPVSTPPQPTTKPSTENTSQKRKSKRFSKDDGSGCKIL